MMEVFSGSDSKQWNSIINVSQNGTLYHSWEWLKVIEKNSDSRLFPLVFFDTKDNQPFGAIPLFFKKKLGLKMIFSPPPGSSVTLGPVINNKLYKQHKFELAYLDFQNGIDDFIRKLRPDSIHIITSPGLQDVRPFSWAHYQVSPFYTYKIDLKQGENGVWSNLSQSLKTNIRKAPTRGITVYESADIQALECVYELVAQRYQQQHRGLPMQFSYLKDLFDEFGGDRLKVYLAKYGDKVIGGQTCVVYKDTTVSWCGGCRSESNNLESNELLMWHTIQQAIQSGSSWFEIEGANTRHLCDAKSRYCPATSLYFTVKKTNIVGYLAEKAYSFKKHSVQ
jgi:hypothetical protein